MFWLYFGCKRKRHKPFCQSEVSELVVTVLSVRRFLNSKVSGSSSSLCSLLFVVCWAALVSKRWAYNIELNCGSAKIFGHSIKSHVERQNHVKWKTKLPYMDSGKGNLIPFTWQAVNSTPGFKSSLQEPVAVFTNVFLQCYLFIVNKSSKLNEEIHCL